MCMCVCVCVCVGVCVRVCVCVSVCQMSCLPLICILIQHIFNTCCGFLDTSCEMCSSPHMTTHFQAKHQKHQAFEAELTANADRIQAVLKMGDSQFHLLPSRMSHRPHACPTDLTHVPPTSRMSHRPHAHRHKNFNVFSSIIS